MIKKYQNPSGNLPNLQGLFRKVTNTPSVRERQQDQAYRFNYNNSVGNVAGKISKITGTQMSEDKQNDVTISHSAKAARKDSQDYYNSQEYTNRLRNAGVSLNNKDLLTTQVQSAPVYSVGNETAGVLAGKGPQFRAQTRVRPSVINGKEYNPGIYYNRGTMHQGLGEGVYGTMAHEFSHWADQKLTSDAKAYNHSLIQGNLNPNAGDYLSRDTEIRARAMDIMLNYRNNASKYKDLDDFLDREGVMKGMTELRKTFKDEKSFRNYMHHFVLNDGDNASKYNLFYYPDKDASNLSYAKRGGKIDTLWFLKHGSKIHIKKKNRGKFTDYCGGKVTDSCIRRAKASGNPTLVKRATFAANARKWKH